MTLLEQFCGALTDQEAGKLKDYPVRGKKGSVLSLALARKDNGSEFTKLAIESLELSKSHLYEINSVLLKECYGVLVPTGDIDLLEFLADKSLPKHFKDQLRICESALPKKTGKNASEFYFAAFEALHRFPFNLVNWDLIEEFGKKYVAALPKSTIEDAFSLELHMLRNTMTRLHAEEAAHGKKMDEYFRKLIAIEKKTSQTSHALLGYNLYYTLSWYWHYIGDDPKQLLHSLQKALPYAKKLNVRSQKEKQLQAELNIGDAYFQLGDTDAALRVFDDIYLKRYSGDALLMKKYYYWLRYCEILIFGSRYADAEKILHEHFEPKFTTSPNTFSATAANYFALLCLIKGDLLRAKEYIDHTNRINSKKDYLILTDLHNRIVEAAYYYLTNDYVFAMSLCQRSMHFLHVNGMKLSVSDFGYKFKIIEAVIKYKEKRLPFPNKVIKHIELLRSPQQGLIGKVLTKIVDELDMKKR